MKQKPITTDVDVFNGENLIYQISNFENGRFRFSEFYASKQAAVNRLNNIKSSCLKSDIDREYFNDLNGELESLYFVNGVSIEISQHKLKEA